MELTQEHFDKTIGNILGKMATKDDLTEIRAEMKNFATKADIATVKEDVAAVKEDIATVKEDIATVRTDLVEQTKELKAYTHEAFEVQQTWMDERFKELITKYDMRERVEKLEKEFREWKLRGAAHG